MHASEGGLSPRVGRNTAEARAGGSPPKLEESEGGCSTSISSAARRTRLLQNGASVEIVARLMGHSSAEVTRKHDDNWIAERQIDAEQAIEKAWKLN